MYILFYSLFHYGLCLYIYIFFNLLIWLYRVLVETRGIFSVWHTESLVAAFKHFVLACRSGDPTQAPCIQRMAS